MKLNDLMTSETQVKEPTYNGDVGFDVISAVEWEKKASKEAEKKSLSDYLKKRSDFRLALRTWKETMWDKETDKKTVNTSSLADMFTEVMVWMGKDPKYMQETYWTSQWNLDLINKMKGIQWGKFSWDIQNYIDGRSDDLTWLVTNMFPEYMARKTWATTQEAATETKKKKTPSTLQDTRSSWERMAENAVNFKWSDIWLESEWQPVQWLVNFWAGVYDNLRKVVPWIRSIANSIAMEKPEKFAEKIDSGMYKDDYDYDKKNWYKWSYEQWKKDMKAQYEDKYNKETSLTKQIDENKWDMRFNLVDEESGAFKGWEITSEIAQQILLDKFLTSAVSKWLWLYRWVKWAEEVAKWTELATKWTELVTKWAEVTADATKTLNKSKNIAQRILDRFNKRWAWQTIAKDTLGWWKAWLEYQLIWDIQNGKLSDEQAYWLSAGLWAFFGGIAWLIWAWGEAIAQPQEKLRTSLQRLWVNDIDDIITHSEAAAKDASMPSAQQMVIDETITEAKKNVKNKLSEVWQNLGNFRKNMWWSDLSIDKFNWTINKALTKKWVWAQIVEKDWVYVVEGYPWQYWDVLNKIVDRINSLKVNLKNKANLLKAWEEVDITSNTSQFEDLLSDLKSISIREPNAEVRQQMIEIENSLLDDLKWSMSTEQRWEYEWYLNEYSNLKNKLNKVWELEQKMWSNNLSKQPKMEDWQYLGEFLDDLYADWTISQNAKDRRIAAVFSDAIYNVPIKESDKVMYPSDNWFWQEVERKLVKLIRNPRSKMTWWWASYWKDYVPSKTTQAAKNVLRRWKEATIWKISTWEGNID